MVVILQVDGLLEAGAGAPKSLIISPWTPWQVTAPVSRSSR